MGGDTGGAKVLIALQGERLAVGDGLAGDGS
jgi:hypothetical protein